MISFQTGASLAKTLFPAFGALGTAGLRIGLAAVILGLIWRPWRPLPDRAQRRAVLVYGVTLGLMNAAFYQAIARLPLGVAVAIEFIGPLAVALAGSRRRLDLLWVALVLAGLALLLLPAEAGLHAGLAKAGLYALDPIGVLFAIAAAVGWASYILAGIRLGRLMPAGRATSLGMIVAALTIVPAACLAGSWPDHDAPRLLLDALGVALLSSAVPYMLELAAMRRMSARAFGVLMSVEPAIASLSGLLLLGEHLALSRWLGILLVVTASAGSVAAGDRR